MIDDIKLRLKSQVSAMTELPVEELDEQTHLAEFGIDSLQALELLVMLERTYRIEIPQEDLKHFTTIQNVAELVARRVQELVTV